MSEASDVTVSRRSLVIAVILIGVLFLGAVAVAFFLGGTYPWGVPSAGLDEVRVAALETIVAEGQQVAPIPTVAPATPTVLPPTQQPPLLVIDLSKVFTESLPNVCPYEDTTQEDIDGEMLIHGGVIYENSALGAADCAAAFEGRWYEGFPPSEDHHITAFYSAAENASMYQGSQWLIPVGAKPREIVYGLGLGKCDNWDAANVEAEPIILDYVDLETHKIVHFPTTCELLRSEGNPLPEEIGLIPGEALPHFRLGYTWGGVIASAVVTGTAGAFTGESRFDESNRGMICSTKSDSLGDNAIGAIDPVWDSQCIYLLDGQIDGRRGVGLVRGVDIEEASATFDASIWPAPAAWNALEWADDFARNNCPLELPIFAFEEGQWTEVETFDCP